MFICLDQTLQHEGPYVYTCVGRLSIGETDLQYYVRTLRLHIVHTVNKGFIQVEDQHFLVSRLWQIDEFIMIDIREPYSLHLGPYEIHCGNCVFIVNLLEISLVIRFFKLRYEVL